ncbi:MAG: (Fe-S)-binding protein [Saprospiraceae bacterium]|nr:(Fe-S)-binding protein [Saprospiraceae bacterium]
MNMNEQRTIKTMAEWAAEGTKPEYLFWVGCAGSYDARAQKVTVAFCTILDNAGITFAILGNEEACTGDPARRAGNEFVFQMLALQNIQTLNGYEVTKIVATCPHCFNTLKNEYPELGGSYEVWHHTQLLNHLLNTGIISVPEQSSTIGLATYHDSCYLGRINGEYDSPRAILETLKVEIKEMNRIKSNGLCCGAGGAQMWKEDEPGSKRINVERSEEALATGAQTIIVNCPFCMTMLSDGLKAKDQQDNVMVYDLSELIVKQNKW